MKINVVVVGMKAFRGVIDGKSIDSGTVYSRIGLDTRNNKEDASGVNFKQGDALEEWKLPDAAAVLRFKNMPMPFTASLEVERFSNGKETRDVVTEMTVQEAVAPVRKVV